MNNSLPTFVVAEPSILCPECHAQNSTAHNFCGRCGALLNPAVYESADQPSVDPGRSPDWTANGIRGYTFEEQERILEWAIQRHWGYAVKQRLFTSARLVRSDSFRAGWAILGILTFPLLIGPAFLLAAYFFGPDYDWVDISVNEWGYVTEYTSSGTRTLPPPQL